MEENPKWKLDEVHLHIEYIIMSKKKFLKFTQECNSNCRIYQSSGY